MEPIKLISIVLCMLGLIPLLNVMYRWKSQKAVMKKAICSTVEVSYCQTVIMKSAGTVYKAISFILVTLSFHLLSFGQLQEMETSKTNWVTMGEIKWLANTKASLKFFISNSDTTYLLYMQDEEKLKNNRDMAVVKHFSIRFSGVDNTAGNLYELLTSFFTPENRKNKDLQKIIKLGNEMVHVQHYPKLTGHAIMFSTKENHILFTQKELKKLFGK